MYSIFLLRVWGLGIGSWGRRAKSDTAKGEREMESIADTFNL